MMPRTLAEIRAERAAAAIRQMRESLPTVTAGLHAECFDRPHNCTPECPSPCPQDDEDPRAWQG